MQHRSSAEGRSWSKPDAPMLSHWFERGLGQVLAPDPSCLPLEGDGSAAGGAEDGGADKGGGAGGEGVDPHGGMWTDFWEVVAPDPKFSASRHGSSHGGSRHRAAASASGSGSVEEKAEEGGCVGARGSSTTMPPPGASAATAPSSGVARGGMVMCVHCHRMTPVEPPSAAAGALGFESPPLKCPSSTAHRTPHSSKSSLAATPRAEDADHLPSARQSVEMMVLSAARSTAHSLLSPTAVWEMQKSVFALCALEALPERKRKRLEKKLAADPTLAGARASSLGSMIRDGFTPLHAAAVAGNTEAAECLVEFVARRRGSGGDSKKDGGADNETEGKEGESAEGGGGGGEDAGAAAAGAYLHSRDLQGRTALHVAAEAGHVSVVKFLKSAMATYPSPAPGIFSPDDAQELLPLSPPPKDGIAATNPARSAGRLPVGPDAPADLVGRTPLGWAATSREAEARQYRRELEEELFSPGDESVCGARTPVVERTGGGRRSARRSARGGGGFMSPETTGEPGIIDEEGGETVMFDRPLPWGISEMPGYRIDMEDAFCAHYPLVPPSCRSSSVASPSSVESSGPTVRVGLFGVFDGHAGSHVSRYLADNFASVLQSTNEWSGYLGGVDGLARALVSACEGVDLDVRAMDFPRDGGSTGIIAVVTEEVVIVANVGDCRCILVQAVVQGENDAPKLVEEVEAVSEEKEVGDNSKQLLEGDGPVEQDKAEPTSGEGKEDKGEPSSATDVADAAAPPQSAPSADPLLEEAKRPALAAASVTITALSQDHKPNIPSERERIEHAGLFVMPDVYRDPDVVGAETEGAEDNLVTIWKVVKGESDKLAVSRAFGDYDFKENADLSAAEQAVVPTPELRMHARDPERDRYLILACDGVWDVMSNDEVGWFVHRSIEKLREEGSGGGDCGGDDDDAVLAGAGDELLDECLRRGSRDNMTVIVVSLESGAAVAGGEREVEGLNRATATKLFTDE